MIGSRIHQYQITASLGAGGMGEVFRARDTRLNRDVAIKVLPKTFASDPDRLRRFEQEAKTLAALNHPNILTIYESGVQENAPYLVSELLEGRTLRETLAEAKGAPLPLRKAADYALQTAQGLAAAHGKGIIHRDLKPENIFVTKDDRLKILDFGLAKLQAPGLRPGISTLRSEADEVAPTLLESTQPGVVLGTPACMSPEQGRGEPADHRSDLFAFGCVLFEMLTGTRKFDSAMKKGDWLEAAVQSYRYQVQGKRNQYVKEPFIRAHDKARQLARPPLPRPLPSAPTLVNTRLA
jgi:eukaryotic-like serine/threonine-protein kinase